MLKPKAETKDERQERHNKAVKGRLVDYRDLIEQAMANCTDDLTVLESAVGALFLCQLYGWKIARMIHSPNTYKKYQQILKVNFEEVSEPYGPIAERANVYKIEQSLKNISRPFSKISRGELSVPGGRTKIDPEQA